MLSFQAYILFYISFTLIARAQEVDLGVTSDVFESNVNDKFELEVVNPLSEGIENIPRDLLLSWQVRRAIRRILAQMPYGWPEHNIPPLAPYVNENLSLNLENSIFSTQTNFKPLQVDGLNNMEINRLTVGLIFKRINFDFNFPNITFTGNFDTSTAINLSDLMNVNVKIKGSGKLDFVLENLRVTGSVRYKLPIFFGSAKILSLRSEVSLGNVRSNLSGFINGIPVGGALNGFIERSVLKYLNDYDFIWNGLIEKHLLPIINMGLEGKTLWKIILWSIPYSENVYDLEVFENTDIEEFHEMLLRKKSNQDTRNF